MTKSCPPPSTSEVSREEQARVLCLRLLTARARTRAELFGQLAKRGYPDDVSDRVLDRLAQVGLVDDVDFAQQWVQSRRVNAGKGKRALAAELRTKGVDNDVITAALADIDAGAERERAEQLVRDKLRREKLGDGDDPKVMRRLVGMLARRGYGQSMAFLPPSFLPSFFRAASALFGCSPALTWTVCGVRSRAGTAASSVSVVAVLVASPLSVVFAAETESSDVTPVFGFFGDSVLALVVGKILASRTLSTTSSFVDGTTFKDRGVLVSFTAGDTAGARPAVNDVANAPTAATGIVARFAKKLSWKLTYSAAKPTSSRPASNSIWANVCRARLTATGAGVPPWMS